MGGNKRARCVRAGVAAALLALAGERSGAASIEPHDPATCARPALWVVSDHDTTIYLFGTLHTHDGRAHWFDHAVRRAFDASDSLVLETLVPPRLGPIAPADGNTGLAGARATVATARSLGMSVELGADLVLNRAALAAGKPVFGLESFEAQIAMYRSLAPPAKAATPAAVSAAAVAAPDPRLAPFLKAMIDSWNRGDAAPFEAVVGAVRAQSPDAYRTLFSTRNAHWADWIGARLDQPGTVFLAVGSGHLVGSDSVQAKLLQRGIRSARIN